MHGVQGLASELAAPIVLRPARREVHAAPAAAPADGGLLHVPRGGRRGLLPEQRLPVRGGGGVRHVGSSLEHAAIRPRCVGLNSVQGEGQGRHEGRGLGERVRCRLMPVIHLQGAAAGQGAGPTAGAHLHLERPPPRRLPGSHPLVEGAGAGHAAGVFLVCHHLLQLLLCCTVPSLTAGILGGGAIGVAAAAAGGLQRLLGVLRQLGQGPTAAQPPPVADRLLLMGRFPAGGPGLHVGVGRAHLRCVASHRPVQMLHLLLLHGLRRGLQVLQGRQAAGAAAAEGGHQAGGLLRGHGAGAAGVGVAAGVLLGHEGLPQQALQHLDQGALVVLLRPRPPQRLQRPRQPHLQGGISSESIIGASPQVVDHFGSQVAL
mmetsp:Transcript_15448/g.46610  ORF Transcript_15448/g.46610 Transcript_15448/m.46610 type:complete len:374 (+) Transcript_15448:1091-2212(+)